MEIKITGCEDCPFCVMNYEHEEDGYFCKINEFLKIEQNGLIEDSVFFNPKTPEWCPLKKENVTIGY